VAKPRPIGDLRLRCRGRTPRGPLGWRERALSWHWLEYSVSEVSKGAAASGRAGRHGL